MPGESTETAARREFREETGSAIPAGTLQPLGMIRQRGGKFVEAFALEGSFDVSKLLSNTFEMEWPPRSGEQSTFPEIDRAQWFVLHEARRKILPSQAPFLDRLAAL
ncbi:MAG: hypothetical protein JWL98_890 [Xanthomonadaceae bacterium]|nr:hypothetical protein [Xanthomonadaceae bacterium]